MKAAAIIFCALLLCSCAGDRRAGAVQAEWGRHIDVSERILESSAADTLDFGRVGSGETLVMDVTLHNFSQKPLVVLEAETTCGCTEIDFPRKPILPGESAPMQVWFHSGGLIGPQFKPFALRTSLGPQRLRVLLVADVY